MLMPCNPLKEIKFELLQYCPLVCLHCSSNSTPKSTPLLEPSLLKKTIIDAKTIGLEFVAFTGGEPLAYHELEWLLHFCQSKRLATCIYTTGITSRNGKFLPFDKSRAKSFHGTGLGKIIFSIHGSCPTTHDDITRIPGSYWLTIESISTAVASGLNTEIHFVPMRSNYKQIPEVVELARKMNVPKVSLLRFVSQGRGEKNQSKLEIPRNCILELKEIIDSVKSSNNPLVRTGAPFNALLEGHAPCKAAIDQAVIDSKGFVYPCDAFKQVRYIDRYSNIRENSIIEIWEKSLFLNDVRDTVSKQDSCSSCSHSFNCSKGCLAQSYLRNKDLSVVEDPFAFEYYLEIVH